MYEWVKVDKQTHLWMSECINRWMDEWNKCL